ncbi:MAG: hypothetical protein K1X83_00095 [Oligoflexia bacterium]|nr:hypothetical protein [Oligoflexia bacterium]
MIPKRIVCFGASTIYGRVDPEGGGFTARLRAWHEGNARSNAVFSLGIEGQRTSALLKRFSLEVPPRNPGLVLINTGLNDTRREGSESAPWSVPLGEFRKNLSDLLQNAKALCEVAVIGPFPIDDTRTRPIRIEPVWYLLSDAAEINAATRDICAKLEVPFLDLFAKWNGKPKPELLYSDGLHCNSAGHAWLFEEAKTFIASR